MPITIWEPVRHVAGFIVDGNHNVSSAVAAAPYNGITRVAEVPRFTGYKTQYYANTGEMEIAIPAGQINPQDVKLGYWVDVDGDNYQIESIEWELTAAGYECTIAGRDFGGMLDRYIQDKNFKLGGSIYPVTRVSIREFFGRFFNEQYTTYYSNSYGALDKSLYAGWWRKNSTSVSATEQYEVTPPDSAGSQEVTDILSFGAQLRIYCNWLGIGYRFDFTKQTAAGVTTMNATPVLYNRANNGVVINANARGISNFRYTADARNIVNACNLSAASSYTPTGHIIGGKTMIYRTIYGHGNADNKNWDDVANNWRGMYVDLGEVPDEYDTSYASVKAWVEKQAEMSTTTKAAEEAIAFDYDNNGAYKYGVHFHLGSTVTVKDDYIGIAATQMLTKVRTNYEAGEAKGYSFEFGDQQITQADKLIEKFRSIDMRTYKARE